MVIAAGSGAQYVFNIISAKKLEKETFSLFDNADAVKSKACEVLQAKGKLYGVWNRDKSKECVHLYIVRRVEDYRAPEGVEKTYDGKNVMVVEEFTKIGNSADRNDLGRTLLSVMLGITDIARTDGIQWGENLLSVKDFKFEIPNLFIWILLAFVTGGALGRLTDNPVLGIATAVTVGALFAYGNGKYTYKGKPLDSEEDMIGEDTEEPETEE